MEVNAYPNLPECQYAVEDGPWGMFFKSGPWGWFGLIGVGLASPVSPALMVCDGLGMVCDGLGLMVCDGLA